MKSLLSVSSDSKTRKGESRGYLTGILYLAPSTVSGRDVCPFASPACNAACLYSAGRGAFSNVQRSRVEKTKAYFENKSDFLSTLSDNIASLISKSNKSSMRPAVRLNGTSDIAWEKSGLMDRFASVPFYDYTKNPLRFAQFLAGKLPSNYRLTFSRSETNEAPSRDLERISCRQRRRDGFAFSRSERCRRWPGGERQSQKRRFRIRCRLNLYPQTLPSNSMATLSKQGSETVRVELLRKTYSFRDNGNVLKNEGEGWKLVRFKEGCNAETLLRSIRDRESRLTPEFLVYRRAVQSEFPLSIRWKFLHLSNLLDTDVDGIWAHLDDEGIRCDLETLRELSLLRSAAIAAHKGPVEA
jgi:hypothetical protein